MPGTPTDRPSPPHAGQQPNPISLLFHLNKTLGLIGGVLADRRVHVLPKMVFLGAVGVLLAALLGSDAVAGLVEAVVGTPIASVIGLPADAAVDWLAFAVAAYNLLRIFPAEIVGEHYDRLFRRGGRIVDSK